VLWASEVSWPWTTIESLQKPALTVNDPDALDNMSSCGLDIVRAARHFRVNISVNVSVAALSA
jgi:hypothetical protein